MGEYSAHVQGLARAPAHTQRAQERQLLILSLRIKECLWICFRKTQLTARCCYSHPKTSQSLTKLNISLTGYILVFFLFVSFFKAGCMSIVFFLDLIRAATHTHRSASENVPPTAHQSGAECLETITKGNTKLLTEDSLKRVTDYASH